MRLFVTLPYQSPADLRDRDYVGQVVRVEQRDDGHVALSSNSCPL